VLVVAEMSTFRLIPPDAIRDAGVFLTKDVESASKQAALWARLAGGTKGMRLLVDGAEVKAGNLLILFSGAEHAGHQQGH
jgi:hypothetical protein